MHRLIKAMGLGLVVLVAACGNGGSDGGGPVSIVPATATVPVGGQKAFTLSSPVSTQWSVAPAIGTISPLGVYTVPFVLPGPSTVTGSGPRATVTVSASAAATTATVDIMSRFINDGALPIGTCPSLGSACINALAAPDLNGDGLSDLVTADTASGTFSVTLRASASGFYAPASYDVGSPAASEPQALAIADLDGNSTLDVVVGDAGATRAVRSRLGAGDGTFGSEVATVLTNTSAPFSIAVGQFDPLAVGGNNGLDVAIARFGNDIDPSEVIIFLGDSTGFFPETTWMRDSASGQVSLPLSVIVADFDNDGYDDLAVANSGGPAANAAANTVSVFFGVGNGTFRDAELYPVPGSPSAVVAVDLNGDSFPDLAVTAAVDNTLTVILNRGASWVSGDHFQPSPFQTYTTGAVPIALTAADVNGDQFQDLVVVNRGANSVTVFLGNGDGTAVLSETYPVGSAPQSVAVGDFNNDSFPDLAVANSGDDTVSILRNRGQ